MTKTKINYSFIFGIVFFGCFVLVTFFEWRWTFLKYKQYQFGFKLLSGFVFLGVLLHQWLFTRLRMDPKSKGIELKKSLSMHKWVGILLPLILLVHTQNWGIRFNFGLSLVFALSMVFGLTIEIVMKSVSPSWSQVWLILHILFSTLLLGLIGSHLYIALSY